MGTITKTKTWADNEGVNYTDINANFDTVYTLANGNIDNDNIKAAAGITYSKLNLTLGITDGDVAATADIKLGSLQFVIDGGGAEIADGIAGFIEVPFDCVLTQATALADQSGSIVVDVWKDTYANYPPTDVDSITGSAPITISSATNSQDTTLSGWTTTVGAGSVLMFNVDSCTTIQKLTISLKYRKS